MNRKAILLLPCLISLLSLGIGERGPHQDINFMTDFPVIGPFEKYGEDYDLTGVVIPQKNYSWIRERLSVGIIGEEPTYFSTKSAHSVAGKSGYPLTFKLPFKSMLGPKGLTCQISFIDQQLTTVYSFSFNIKPKTSQRINPFNYLNSYYSILDTIVDPDDYGTVVGEAFCFNGFIDYFNIDYYYRLNIDNLYLTYVGLRDFPTSTIYLYFDDYDGLFPDIGTGDSNSSVYIPIEAYEDENSSIRFKISAKLYVNPQTLHMSLEAKPGYVLTNYFYLPVNRKQDLMNQKFSLLATSFGYNQTSFSWDIRYLTDRGLIGDCASSDYCVRGGING